MGRLKMFLAKGKKPVGVYERKKIICSSELATDQQLIFSGTKYLKLAKGFFPVVKLVLKVRQPLGKPQKN